jgi:hypothetical protein
MHYMTTWTQAAELPTDPDGRITTIGVEARAINTRFGNGYLGYSHLISKNPVRVGGGIETIHSWEGWSLIENYFGEPDVATGNGTIDTIGWQARLQPRHVPCATPRRSTARGRIC